MNTFLMSNIAGPSIPEERAPDLRPMSIRSSLIARIPRGFRLTALKSETNSTMSGIPGPGRLVDSALTSVGRRFERVVDRFAEEQLGQGPNMAAHQLATALQYTHVSKSYGCKQNNVLNGPDNSTHASDRLIWACNGFCSRCYYPYLPVALNDLPERASQAILQLLKCVRAVEPASNIALAAMYIRILIESRVLVPLLLERLDILTVLTASYNDLLPQDWGSGFQPPEEVSAVKDAIFAIQQQATNTGDSLPEAGRFITAKSGETTVLEVLDGLVPVIRGSASWTIREIAFTQYLSSLSLMANFHINALPTLPVQQMLMIATDAQKCSNVTLPSIHRSIRLCWRLVAIYISDQSLNLKGHVRDVTAVTFSSSGRTIVSGSEDQIVRLWDTTTGRSLGILTGNTAWVSSVAISKDTKFVISGDFDGHVTVWDLKTRQKVSVLNDQRRAYIRSVTLSPDNSYIASGSQLHSIRIWDVKTESIVSALKGQNDSIRSVVYSEDGRELLSSSNDGTIRMWDIRSRTSISYTHQGPRLPVPSAQLSPDNMYIASGSVDNIVRLWDVKTRRQLTTLVGHYGCVSSVAFSPDGRHLVSGSHDQSIRLWRVKTSSQVATFCGHSKLVSSVAFSSDGKHVASGSFDQTVRVWDIGSFTNAPTPTPGEQAQVIVDRPKFRSSKNPNLVNYLVRSKPGMKHLEAACQDVRRIRLIQAGGSGRLE